MKKFIVCMFVAVLALSVSADLIISEVADPADNSGGRYIQLFNAGYESVDLAAGRYYLVRRAGGSAWSTQLTGTLGAKSVFIVAANESDFNNLYGFAPDVVNNLVGDVDGYNCVFLNTGGGAWVGDEYDAYGTWISSGEGQPWEYVNTRATRVDDVMTPDPAWVASEWTIPVSANVSDMDPANHGAVIPEPAIFGLIGLSLLYFCKK